MSKEFKAPRPIPEIQAEFSGLCTRAGHLQYQIVTLQKDLDLLNATIRDLNFEAAASQKYAEEQAKKDAAKTEEVKPALEAVK